MCNYYSAVNDIVLTFSNIFEEDGTDVIDVRFERANKSGFDFAEGKIPHFIFNKSYGFSEDELLNLERYLRNNSSLIWDLAREKAGDAIA